ncbi:MAG: pyridoxamine 5'-phosphate oxidase [Deltaproteobacteria bacterium]|nr:pyridoxamine 5'-phosphate oxidase [Deltaproteobacteria bacterium]
MSLASLRTIYQHAPLLEADAATDPLAQFNAWMQDAIAAELPEPNAMTLATVDGDAPQTRVVLLRGADHEGFVFYTNYTSEKARQIAKNPRVALSFFWPQLLRQVRIAGAATRVPEGMSDAYFASRPRGHQLGAWVSDQSRVIASRSVIEDRTREVEAEFAGTDVPRPPHWGGFRVVPNTYEFWQGQENRLHDRLRYRLVDAAWVRERLAP